MKADDERKDEAEQMIGEKMKRISQTNASALASMKWSRIIAARSGLNFGRLANNPALR